jgi:uroporphyrinogen decarboxylase
MINIKNRYINKTVLVDYLANKEVTESLYDYFSVDNEKNLLEKLRCDFYYLSCRDISQNESCLSLYKGPTLNINKNERSCPLGISWKRMVHDDKFGVDETIKGPLQKSMVTIKDILRLELPKPKWFDFSKLAEEYELFSDKIIIGGLWSAIHGDSFRLMGYENYLLNFAMDKDLIKNLVNKMTDFYLEMNIRYFNTVRDKMDIFFMGNDFGSQSGLLISKEDWYEIYFENYKKLIDLAHSYNYKVMVHSCGSIEPLIQDFINLGVDIIDPVQITAKDMNPELLAEKYGKDICFHGALDTQSILPYGNTEEARSHVIETVRTLNRYKKYVAAPSNNFMPGTPPQNIAVVYSTLKQLNNTFHES